MPALPLSALLVACALALPLRAQDAPLPVVPHPQEVRFGNGFFALGATPPEVRLSVADTSGTGVALRQLTEALGMVRADTDRARVAGPGGPPSRSAGRRIWLGNPDEDSAFAAAWQRVGRWPDDRLGTEGYALHVAAEEIVVAATSSQGLFYGVQTLVQLLRAHHPDTRLPAVHIVDWPDLTLRGMMDDISRGPIPTPETFRSQIRRAAELKINFLMYYTENVVETESHGDFTAPGGAVSVAEWRELADYARRHHVMLVGNFQSFGHFYDILNYPQYAHLGESGTLLSPVVEESYTLLRNLYDELIPAFDAPLFSVHSDETFDLGKGASKALVDSIGLGAVYARHINRMHEIVTGHHGRRMVIWSDVLLEHPEVMDLIPKDILIGAWTYDVLPSYDRYIRPITDAGFEVIVVPGVLNSYRTMPDFRVAEANIKGFVADGLRLGAIGMMNTVWDDGGSAIFARDWYGVAAGADQAWRSAPEDRTLRDRFDPALYGDRAGTIARAVEALVTLADIEVTDGLMERVLWTEVIPARGQRSLISGQGWDTVLEVVEAAESALENAEPRDWTSDHEAFRFTAAQYRYLAQSRLGLISAADSYRSALLAQRSDRAEARRHATDALRQLNEVRLGLDRLRGLYAAVWLGENRAFALDWMTDEYDAHLAALRDVERRVMSALSDFDKGHPLLPPTEVRLAIEATDARYLREWLMTNPIPNPAGRDVDYLAPMGGEATVQPRVTEEFQHGGQTYRWRRTASPLFDRVDLRSEFGAAPNSVVYAHATIRSPRTESVRALLGHSDGIEVFLNGERVHRRTGPRRFAPDEDEVVLPLREGVNHLMLKLIHGEGDWLFTLQLPDHRIRSSKNRYYILD